MTQERSCKLHQASRIVCSFLDRMCCFPLFHNTPWLSLLVGLQVPPIAVVDILGLPPAEASSLSAFVQSFLHEVRCSQHVPIALGSPPIVPKPYVELLRSRRDLVLTLTPMEGTRHGTGSVNPRQVASCASGGRGAQADGSRQCGLACRW